MGPGYYIPERSGGVQRCTMPCANCTGPVCSIFLPGRCEAPETVLPGAGYSASCRSRSLDARATPSWRQGRMIDLNSSWSVSIAYRPGLRFQHRGCQLGSFGFLTRRYKITPGHGFIHLLFMFRKTWYWISAHLWLPTRFLLISICPVVCLMASLQGKTCAYLETVPQIQ